VIKEERGGLLSSHFIGEGKRGKREGGGRCQDISSRKKEKRYKRTPPERKHEKKRRRYVDGLFF